MCGIDGNFVNYPPCDNRTSEQIMVEIMLIRLTHTNAEGY